MNETTNVINDMRADYMILMPSFASLLHPIVILRKPLSTPSRNVWLSIFLQKAYEMKINNHGKLL